MEAANHGINQFGGLESLALLWLMEDCSWHFGVDVVVLWVRITPSAFLICFQRYLYPIVQTVLSKFQSCAERNSPVGVKPQDPLLLSGDQARRISEHQTPLLDPEGSAGSVDTHSDESSLSLVLTVPDVRTEGQPGDGDETGNGTPISTGYESEAAREDSDVPQLTTQLQTTSSDPQGDEWSIDSLSMYAHPSQS